VGPRTGPDDDRRKKLAHTGNQLRTISRLARIQSYRLKYEFHQQLLLKDLQTKTQPRGELYRSSYRLLSAKLVPNFAERGCHVVKATDAHGR
jgi:hypothetical protein